MNSYSIPRSVQGLNNSSYFYYYKKLQKMIYSIFKIENVPESWSLPYIKEALVNNGVFVVTNTPAGILALKTGYSGINVYNQPTEFIITNPVLDNIEGKIDDDGVMVYLSIVDGKYEPLAPLINRYATLLSEIDASLQTTLINSRVAHIFTANSTAQLKAMQKMYDEISTGKPAVFVRKNGLEEDASHAEFSNVKNTYIGTELLDTKRTIMNEFLTEIGINNANTDKKERLISDEVNANNSEMMSNVEEWFNNLEECITKVNNKYNLNIKVSLNTFVGGYDGNSNIKSDL